jgi:hypothetical protein
MATKITLRWKTISMKALQTRRCGSGSAACSTRSTSTRRMRGRSGSNSHPSLNMLAGLAGDSGAHVPHQPVSAATKSGRGRKPKASQSATVGASLPASLSSTRQPPQTADLSRIHVRCKPNSQVLDLGAT